MSFAFQAIVDAMVSHAAALGRFERVNTHELKSEPGGGGLTASIWTQSMAGVAAASGLASMSTLLVMRVRIYSPTVFQPEESIDPTIVNAISDLWSAYSSNFTLGGLVRNVDLLGAHGSPIRYDSGYLTIGQRTFRVFDIDVPIIVNDVFNESP